MKTIRKAGFVGLLVLAALLLPSTHSDAGPFDPVSYEEAFDVCKGSSDVQACVTTICRWWTCY